MWRQLLQRPEGANVSTLARAVVLLESNLGMSELEAMLTEGLDTGGEGGGGGGGGEGAAAAAIAEARGRASAEEAERRLRDAVFARWRRDACEPYEDTLKLVSLVDFFLPYFPLERRHVDELTERALRARAEGLARVAAAAAAVAADENDDGETEDEDEDGEQDGACAATDGDASAAANDHGGTFWPPLPSAEELGRPSCARPGRRGLSPPLLRLAWRPPVVRFLSGRVEFSGPFPLEGAKGVESAVTRHVARLLRRAAEASAAQRRERRRLARAAGGQGEEEEPPPPPPPLPPPPLADTLLLFVGPPGGSEAREELKAELVTAGEARARMAREAAEEEEEEEQSGVGAGDGGGRGAGPGRERDAGQ
jgi:hypothetical protein